MLILTSPVAPIVRPNSAPPRTATGITFAPASPLSLTAGGAAVAITATPTDAQGAIPGKTVTWNAGNTAVATLATNGNVATLTPVAAGQYVLQASVDGATASVQVGVSGAVVASGMTDALRVTPLETVRVAGPGVDVTHVGALAMRTTVGAQRRGRVWSAPGRTPTSPIDRAATVTISNVGTGITVSSVPELDGGSYSTQALGIVGLTPGYWMFDVTTTGTYNGQAYSRTVTVPVVVEPAGITAIRPRVLPDDAWVHPRTDQPVVHVANESALLAMNNSTARGTVYVLDKAVYTISDTWAPAAPSGTATGFTYCIPKALHEGIVAGMVTPAEVERRIHDDEVASLATIKLNHPENETAQLKGGIGWRLGRIGITAAEITTPNGRVYNVAQIGDAAGASDAACGMGYGLFGCAFYGVFDHQTQPEATLTRSTVPTVGNDVLTITLAAPAPVSIVTGDNGIGTRVRIRRPGRAALYDQGAYVTVGPEGHTGSWGAFCATAYVRNADGTGTLSLKCSNNDYQHGSDADPNKYDNGCKVEFWNSVAQHFRRGALVSGRGHVVRGCRVFNVQVQHDNQAADYDSQGFAFFAGTGSHAMIDCAITGPSTEMHAVGGSSAPSAALVPYNILFDRCYFSRKGYSPRCWGGLWNCKNLYESKTGDGVELYRCWYDWNMPGDLNQPGYAFVLKTQIYKDYATNQQAQYPNSATANVSIRDCVVDRSVGVAEWTGYQPNGNDNNYPGDYDTHDIEIDNVLFMRCLTHVVANKGGVMQLGGSSELNNTATGRLRNVRVGRLTHYGRWESIIDYPSAIAIGASGSADATDALIFSLCAIRAAAWPNSSAKCVFTGAPFGADDDSSWNAYTGPGSAVDRCAFFDALGDTSTILGGTNLRLGDYTTQFVGDISTSADPLDYRPKAGSQLAALGAAADPVRLVAQCAGVAE